MNKRILALALAFVMLFSLLPTAAFAEDGQSCEEPEQAEAAAEIPEEVPVDEPELTEEAPAEVPEQTEQEPAEEPEDAVQPEEKPALTEDEQAETAEELAFADSIPLADAGTVVASGSCGENLTWTLDGEGLLTISGTGEMEDYNLDNTPWYSNRESIRKVTIKSGVTSIGNHAFRDCISLTSIDIPDSLTSISYDAFGNCFNLSSLSIPDSVTSIGEYAFFNCGNLTSITIPESVISIVGKSFYQCSSLTEINVAPGNENYTSVDGILFNKAMTELICYPAAKSQTAYTVPNGVTKISSAAFCDCSSLASIVLPDSLTYIGQEAFRLCTGLTSISIPKNVTSIDEIPFVLCYSLSEINIESGSKNYSSVDGVLFDIAKTELICYPAGKAQTSYAVPESVKIIGRSAFNSCQKMTSISIPESVTSIGNYVFHSCRSLNYITFKGDAPKIGNYAFSELTASVYYPKDNDTWTNEVCQNYGGNIVWLAYDPSDPTAPIIASGSCGENLTWTLDTDGLLTISGSGAMNNYNDSTERTWCNVIKLVIEPGAKSIGNYAFSGCTGLTSVTIPNSVTSIGDGAFQWCSSLTSVTLPNSVSSIGDITFGGCSGLTSVTIPESVTSIGDYAFSRCSGLTSVTIPDSVTSIGDFPFFRCSSLTDISVAAGNSNFSSLDGVLYNKAKTELISYPAGKTDKSYSFPKTVTSIGKGAFYECSSLTSVNILNSVTSIGDYAFQYSNLTSVSIPGSVMSIGDGAFSGCRSLTEISVSADNSNFISLDGVLFNQAKAELIAYPAGKSDKTYALPKSVTSIGAGAFMECRSLTDISIPEGVTSIGDYAIANCSSLTSISIPKGMTSIGESAFFNCRSLTRISIPKGVTSIGDYAFIHCSSLKEITFKGKTPAIGETAFYNITATAHYPANDSTWTDEVRQSYGGNITWLAYEPELDPVEKQENFC